MTDKTEDELREEQEKIKEEIAKDESNRIRKEKLKKGVKFAGRAAGRGVEYTGKEIAGIFRFLFNERSLSWGKGGMLIGALLGIALGILLSSATGLPFGLNVIYGVVAGILLGGILGIILGSVPQGAATIAFFIVILLAGYTGYASGFFSKISGEYGTGISAGTESILKSITCFFSPECLKKTFYEGWDTDTKREEIDFEVKVLTTNFYDEGNDERVKVRINVKNSIEKGVDEFKIEPECYIDGKKVDADYSDLTFTKSDSEQFSSFDCIVPASSISGKESIKSKIILKRPAKSSVTWTAKTLEKEKIKNYLSAKESGNKIKYSTLPYSFEMGIRRSLPLSEDNEGERLEIKLVKESELKGEIDGITKLEIYGGGETADINSCDGFKKLNDKFVLEKVDNKKEFECELTISPTLESDAAESVIFKADVEYILKIEMNKVIPVLKR